MEELLKLERSGELTVNPEIMIYPQFDAIRRSDRSKDKTRTLTALRFIYLMHDTRSDYISSYPDEKTRKARILKDLDFDLGIFEKEVMTAANYYKERTMTPSIKFLLSLHKALQNSYDLVEALSEEAKALLSEYRRLKESVEITDIQLKQSLLSRIMDLITSLNNLAKTTPSQLETLDKAIKQVKAELQEVKIAQGGVNVRDRENPDYIAKFGDRPVELRR